MEEGPCLASKPRYYYNIETNLCGNFTYGGCKGNENNFITLAECQSMCPSRGMHSTAVDKNQNHIQWITSSNNYVMTTRNITLSVGQSNAMTTSITTMQIINEIKKL